MNTYISVGLFFVFLSTYFYFIFAKSNPDNIKWVLLVGSFLLFLLPFLLSNKISDAIGDYYKIYALTLNIIFVTAIILFLILCIYKFSGLFIKSLSLDNKTSLVLIATSFVISLFSVYEANKVPHVKEVDIYSKKITKDYKIVFLSDLHLARSTNHNKIKNMIPIINALKPDAIILGGDIIDDTSQHTKPLLNELKNLKAKNGVYFVMGNHDVYRGVLQSLNQLQSQGFKFLSNSGQKAEELYIAGIPDMTAQKTKVYINEALKNADKTAYKILGSHTPHSFGDKNNFDLMLSGHTHGGQIFPFHVFVKLRHKYFQGLYDMENNAKIYVSRGTGQWGPQLRFLAPAEITLINLMPQK